MERGEKIHGLYVGVTGIDVIFHMKSDLPGKNEKKTVRDFEMQIGGPAAKAAMTCAALGGKATLMTCIGDSAQGRMVKAELAELGIDVIDLVHRGIDVTDLAQRGTDVTGLAREDFPVPNISAVFLDEAAGTRTVVSGQHSLQGISLPGSVGWGNDRCCDDCVDDYDQCLRDYDYCLYDCNLQDLTPDITAALAAADVPLILDCGSWKQNIEDALSHAQIAISSSVFTSPEGKNIFDLQVECGIPAAARTNEGDPIEYSVAGDTGTPAQKIVTGPPGESLVTGTIPVQKLDSGITIGAGDVLHGAFCYYHMHARKAVVDALSCAARFATEYVRTGRLLNVRTGEI